MVDVPLGDSDPLAAPTWPPAPESADEQVAYAQQPVEVVTTTQYVPVTEVAETTTQYVTVPAGAEVPVTGTRGDFDGAQPRGPQSFAQQTVGVEPPLEGTTQVPTTAIPTTPITPNVFGNQTIEPVRSPGIVISGPEEQVVTEAAEPEVVEEPTVNTRHVLPWVLLVVGVLGALLALAQLVPGWWSRFIADLVDGYTGRGAAWGAGFGFLFTYLATLLIGHAVRKWTSWKAPIALVVAGLVVASPNLFTLWINRGPTHAAQVANALLDRSAPLFRGASLAGAAGGLVLGILTTVLYRMWRARTRRLREAEVLAAGTGRHRLVRL